MSDFKANAFLASLRMEVAESKHRKTMYKLRRTRLISQIKWAERWMWLYVLTMPLYPLLFVLPGNPIDGGSILFTAGLVILSVFSMLNELRKRDFAIERLRDLNENIS